MTKKQRENLIQALVALDRACRAVEIGDKLIATRAMSLVRVAIEGTLPAYVVTLVDKQLMEIKK